MRVLTIGLVVCAGALAGCAASKPAPAPEPAPAAQGATPAPPAVGGKIDERTVTASATVESVDQKTRHVTLKRPDGTKFTIVAGPDVRNLAQVKKGDVVRITYNQSIAYEVKKSGQGGGGVSTTSDLTRAPLGAKPGGTVTDTVTVSMTITAINKATSEATLLGPDGNVHVVKARDPAKLDAVRVGDVVDITYTEALGIAVEKAGGR